jgi:hypothetical protein
VFSQQIQPLLAKFPHLLFDQELVSRVSMQAGSGKATDRIRGIGWPWRNLSEFQSKMDYQFSN